MAMWGADIAQLTTLGTKLQAGSSEIDQQKSLLTKVLEGTDWKGPDAEAASGTASTLPPSRRFPRRCRRPASRPPQRRRAGNASR